MSASSDGLRERYLRYIDVLNERRFDDLVDFVADELTYNDELITRADYQRLLRGDVDAIPDLRFVVDRLVSEGDQVACRLVFDCEPVKSFLGLPAPGRPIRFAEHVFYRFAAGRIVEVRSLIDRDAVRRQLG